MDFYENFAKFSYDLMKKLRELKEIDHEVRRKEAMERFVKRLREII